MDNHVLGEAEMQDHTESVREKTKSYAGPYYRGVSDTNCRIIKPGKFRCVGNPLSILDQSIDYGEA